MDDGSEKPVGFASRTLSAAEKNYAQIEREGLACIFGVKRFHSYLYGHKFELVTDHKPLLSLFEEKRSISPQASGRIQRWALLLNMYQYVLSFKPTNDHGNADALSRLPLPHIPQDTPQPAEMVLMMEHLNSSPTTATSIRAWTRTDPLMSRVLQFVQNGWPEVVDQDELKPFWRRKVELSCLDGCVLWGNRVIVPKEGQEAVLQELHDAHPGETRMKRLARMFVWWPGITEQIESTVKKCPECQKNQQNPPLAPLLPWKWPTRPWSRLHIDFAGPFLNNMYLVLVDSHSKWMEVHVMPSITASATIKCLRGIFAQFGLPERIVSDNGPTFTSGEFQQFLLKNGIQHTTPPPYHPASNGLAERAVRTFKTGVQKLSGDIHTKIARFLFHYRISPQSTTGVSPAELLMGRRLRSTLDLLKPDLEKRVANQQDKQKQAHDMGTKDRQLKEGEEVYAQNFGPGEKWLPATVVKVHGPRVFEVELREDKRLWRRHIENLHHRYVDDSSLQDGSSFQEAPRSPLEYPSFPAPGPPPLVTQAPAPPPPTPRYPTRGRTCPNRYGHNIYT